MKLFYSILATLMLLGAIIYFFILVFAFKIFLTEMSVNGTTFIILGALTLVVLVASRLTYYFYGLYKEVA